MLRDNCEPVKNYPLYPKGDDIIVGTQRPMVEEIMKKRKSVWFSKAVKYLKDARAN